MLYSIDIDYDEIEKENIKYKIENFLNEKITIFNENYNFDYIFKNKNIFIKIIINKFHFYDYDFQFFKKSSINYYNKILKNKNNKNVIYIFINFLKNQLYFYKYEIQNADNNNKNNKILLNNFINVI